MYIDKKLGSGVKAVQTISRLNRPAKNKRTFVMDFVNNTDEIKATTSKLNSIKTYVDEHFVKFVMGTYPLSDFDKYYAQLEKMGIKDVIKVYQGAQDRFVKQYPDYQIPYDTDISELFSK